MRAPGGTVGGRCIGVLGGPGPGGRGKRIFFLLRAGGKILFFFDQRLVKRERKQAGTSSAYIGMGYPLFLEEAR